MAAGLLICIMLLFTGVCGAICEPSFEILADEWTWEAGGVCRFHGEILSDQDIPDAEVELEIKTRLQDSGSISFTELNGKRIKIRKQGPTQKADLQKGISLPFEGQWILPDELEQEISFAEIELSVRDSTGNTLGKGRMQMGTPEGNAGLLQEITADRMALLLLMAGIILWLAALGRHAMLNKMNKLKGI